MSISNNIKKNEHYYMTIHDLGNHGEGVGKVENFTLFVEGAIPGDEIEVRVVKVKKKYGYGKLIKIINPSPYRVEPICPITQKCGGCQIQHIQYEEQLKIKYKKVKDHLERIGGLKNVLIHPVIGMDHPYCYRNKALFPVGMSNGEVQIGFFAPRSHNIMDMDQCYIQHPVTEKVIFLIREFITKYHLSIYDEKEHTGLLRHILVRTSWNTKEVLVCLVINGKKIPYADQLVQYLQQIPHIVGILLSINEERTNVALGEKIQVLWGKDYIVDSIGELQFHISPLSFFQVNPIQTKILYDKALEYAALTGEEVVWDAYCGIGTISLFLAQKAKCVYGVEIVDAAINNAKENAKLNHINNVEFFVGKAEEVIPQKLKEEGIKADVMVVDPPRKGCDSELLKTIVEMSPDRMIYVSCDSATLARDLKYLVEKGYAVKEVQPVDLFPQTMHVETVCLLSKLNAKQHIEINLDMDELDLTDAEKKATYQEIKDYVLEHSGLKVSSLYIAQVKQKCGIIERENYNKPKSEDAKQPQCPPDKEKEIKEALTHFGMI